MSGGHKYKVKAKREIILSAGKFLLATRLVLAGSADFDALILSGTFKTPQLLELSGIGDRSLLKSFDIESQIDLPGVGENLLDQTYTLIDFVAKKHVKTLGAYLSSLID